jgi:hypothetical protein
LGFCPEATAQIRPGVAVFRLPRVCSKYHLLAARIGNGYATAKSAHLFRDFINGSAHVAITENHILVRFQKRAQLVAPAS